MNSCEFSKQVHRLVDGELSPEHEQKVREHVAQCAECAALLADLEKLRTGFSLLTSESPSAGFEARILERIAAQDAAAAPGLWGELDRLSRKFLPAAACFVALLAGVLFMSPNRGATHGSDRTLQVAAVAQQQVRALEQQTVSQSAESVTQTTGYLNTMLSENEMNFLVSEDTGVVDAFYQSYYQNM